MFSCELLDITFVIPCRYWVTHLSTISAIFPWDLFGSECDHAIARDFFAAPISAAGRCNFSAYPCDSKEDADNKIGVRFYLERENSATSGWINVGREWCCRGWSIEGGTPGGLLRTRDGLPRIRKERAARNVHECESVCAWNKNIVSAPKWLPCINDCMCAVFHCICICMCSN